MILMKLRRYLPLLLFYGLLALSCATGFAQEEAPAAEAAPASLPEKIVVATLGEALPAPVLHFFAAHLPVEKTAPLE